MILISPLHSFHVLIKQVWYPVFLLELDSSAPPRGLAKVQTGDYPEEDLAKFGYRPRYESFVM